MASNSQIPQMIADAAARYGVPAPLAVEVGAVESNFNQSALSLKGAIGVMQLMPATAADLGVNPYDVTQNIDGGVRELAQLLSRYGGDASKALAAYNWGASKVDSAIASSGDGWFASIPSSVQGYVNKILNAIGSASAVSAAPGATPAPAAGSPAAAPSGANAFLYVSLVGVGALLLADFVFGDA